MIRSIELPGPYRDRAPVMDHGSVKAEHVMQGWLHTWEAGQQSMVDSFKDNHARFRFTTAGNIMNYTPPQMPLPKTGKAMQIYIANDKRSASAFTDKPVASIHIEKPFKGRDWSGVVRDEKGVVIFDGYLVGSEHASPRQALGSLLENQGLR